VRCMNLNGVTVRELLKLPILEHAKLVSGEKGLDRVVRFVDIMEVPDIKNWLREGELVLTTGYSMRDDLALLPELIQHLAQANAAGVAIKPERFINDIPQEMLDMSNLHHIPIIQLPIGTPYIDITYAVMDQILDKQAVLLRRSEEIYKALTSLVLNNSGIQVVADNVADLVKSSIWVIGKNGDILVSSPPQVPYHPSENTRYWEVTVDKQLIGKFVVGKEHLDDLELVCVEHARQVFSLELMRKKIAEDTELRLRGNFFEELLMSFSLPQQDAENKGRQLGLDSEWIWEIGIVEGESPFFDYGSSFLTELNEIIHKESADRKVRSHVHLQGGQLVLFLASVKITEDSRKPYGEQSPKAWSEVLHPFLRRWKAVRTGFGNKCFLWEVHRSYFEAKRAIHIGIRLNKDQQLFSFEEVEMYHLLLQSSDYVHFDDLIRKKIGKLSEYDNENGTDLVTTLYHYLATGGSLIETASRLYINRNSVKYRMDRINEITNSDMGNAVNRFEYYVCTVFYLLKRIN
jgi:purine catabolism regulator